MCGVAAYLGTGEAVPVLLGALARQAERGEDSAGLAMPLAGALAVRRAVGRCPQLAALLTAAPLNGGCGIAHTRGATVGGVTEQNAHPHASGDGRVAIVHAGSITNHLALRAELQAAGVVFAGDSDSEVIPHLVARAYAGDPLAALRATAARLTGNFAILALFADAPERIVALRQGSPLVVGAIPAGAEGSGQTLVLASILRGLPADARRVWFPPDGSVIDLGPHGLRVWTIAGVALPLVPWRRTTARVVVAGRAGVLRLRRLAGRLVPWRPWRRRAADC